MGGTIRLRRVLFWLILLGALGLRLRGIGNPLLDDQAWRQGDTAAMAFWMKGHLIDFPDVFFPKLSYDGVIAQRVELEFPFLPYLTACTWAIAGQADIWGRAWAVGFSLLSVWGIYRLGRELLNDTVGLLAAAFYAVVPLGVFYGRVMMPEPVAQAFSIWALALAARAGTQRRYGRVLVPGMLMALAVLSKLPQLMILPVALCLLFFPERPSGEGTRDVRRYFQEGIGGELALYLLIALGLPALYYSWVHVGSPEASRFVSGIIRGQVAEAQPPLLSYAKLVYHMALYLSGALILTAAAGIGRLLRCWRRLRRAAVSLLLWSAISLLYIGWICLPIPLDYYLMPVAPLLALLAALALEGMEFRRGALTGVIVVGLLVCRLGTVEMENKYAVQIDYRSQALWLKEHTPTDSVLLLSDEEPMTFYYAERAGFRLLAEDDRQACAQIQNLPAQYLVKLPQTRRGSAFWQEIEGRYPEVGPGVFRLDDD
ncbi:MAG: glycosyltransferase family 39 protein [Peptococcaceae bacterium]|jgi:hypothetical protein|nr:glycosyltransferase family 39 protein [Peptococcaceae bacterium]